ncbi:MAG TPA: hypothetical protein VG735_08080 [Caulobacterales bacterium]|nr:hypothetical protein [Caulobacterales bacterium]
MSQTYEDIPEAEARSASRPKIIARDDANRSDFSGTSFPTSPAPVAGQRCFRTDLVATFRYNGSAWKRLPSALETVFAFDTIALLRAMDAAAQVDDGQRAEVLGRSAAGDSRAFTVAWSASSSATHDNVSVFRPSTGAAASGNGRWLLVASAITQNFTSGDATPSVGHGAWFVTAGTTPITAFDDIHENHRFTVQRGASDIVITDGAGIDCGGVSITLTASYPRAEFICQGNVCRLVGGMVQPNVKYGAAGAVALPLVQIMQRVSLSVQGFAGYDNSGATDQTATMNAARAACISLARRHLEVPAGLYRNDTQMDPFNGIRLHGDGSASTIFDIRHNGQAFTFDGASGFNNGGMDGFAIHKGVGTYGGYTIVMQGDSAVQPDQMFLRDLYCSSMGSTISAPGCSISLSATTGSSVTVTASGGAPFTTGAIQIGKTRVRACASSIYGTGWGIITARTSDTQVTIHTYQDFLTTSFASGAWAMTFDPCWDWSLYLNGSLRTHPQGIRVGSLNTCQFFDALNGSLLWNMVQFDISNFGQYQGLGTPDGATVFIGGGGASDTNSTQFNISRISCSTLDISNCDDFEIRGGNANLVKTNTTAIHGRTSLRCPNPVSGTPHASHDLELY